MLHKIFIENPDNPNFEANDLDYVINKHFYTFSRAKLIKVICILFQKSYLENFNKIMDVDDE